MVRMIIDRPFNLLVEPGKRVSFKAGEQDVPEEFASHWYVLANGRALGRVAEAEAMEEGEAEPETPETPFEEPDELETPEPGADREADAPSDERAALVVEAEAMGLTIDKRWGIDRIRAAIDSAKA